MVRSKTKARKLERCSGTEDQRRRGRITRKRLITFRAGSWVCLVALMVGVWVFENAGETEDDLCRAGCWNWPS